jgi:hypothetical protein
MNNCRRRISVSASSSRSTLAVSVAWSRAPRLVPQGCGRSLDERLAPLPLFQRWIRSVHGYFQAHFAGHAASREIAHNPLMRHARFNHQLGKKLC